ncbi:hypothetical protein SAMN05444354_1392 [Stigmatella aurantiaca]|uniref:Uncharacterized protein n=1 Tax=Stigmatella aurantiaca TaxID=41 RepID=A0A1H8FSB0_STIAU|nr:hypothetical protein [Stigmatella aurantiaca]SEN34539.1 hypothetical protein SAMN05444354_1392 [Stigmatella aurantiaca]
MNRAIRGMTAVASLFWTAGAYASISLSVMSNDATTVSYVVDYSDTRTNRQLYLDTDRSTLTGFRFNGAGNEYLLATDSLYRFSGADNSYEWKWTFVTQVSYRDEVDASGLHRVSWVIPRSAINSPTVLDVSAKVEGGPGVEQTVRKTHTLATSFQPLARDPLKQPFASNSIWNRPIGNGATYSPAGLPQVPSGDVWAMMPQIDDDRIVLRPNAPVTPVSYNGAAWSGANRCDPQSSSVLTNVPIPADYVVPNSRMNNSAAFLMADGRTLIQSQPLTRCTVGGAATSLLAFAPVDLYGPGNYGAHGGSNLSALGGSIRLNDFVPGGQGARHALKLNVDSREVLYRCGANNSTTPKTDDEKRKDCYRWPATKADSDALQAYGTIATVPPSYEMRMGALLAIPRSVDINSIAWNSELGKQFAWTLQNYGAYIVDSTGGPGYAFSAENGPDGSVRDQVQALFGHSIEARVRDSSPWRVDLQRIIGLLQVVTNNGPASGPAGGGTPLQPFLPELPAY